MVIRNDWGEIKLKVMESIVTVKFSDPTLARKLLDTGGATLIEGNDWGDTFWGVYRGKGRNELGKILMRVREELSNAK